MKAMLLTETRAAGQASLDLADLPMPEPGPGEIRVRITACGVCHTDLDEREGRLEAKLPVVPGHQVVGLVDARGPEAKRHRLGDRVGVAWMYSACGDCPDCQAGNENLCPQFRGTGCDVNGGYAEFMVVPQASAYPIPAPFRDVEAAPLLCAGVVGYRALRLTGIADGQPLGFFGFGASAHIVIQAARYRFPNARLCVFTRPGQIEHQRLAMQLGADWAGETGQEPPERLHAAIDSTPAWTPIVEALRVLRPAGRLVINAIRKEAGDQEALLRIEYAEHLWREKEIKTVANVTRRDAREFLPLAAAIPIRPKTQVFRLEQASEALQRVKHGRTQGAAVLRIADSGPEGRAASDRS
jgi:propanol-preferring alcohol dehydrogenase